MGIRNNFEGSKCRKAEKVTVIVVYNNGKIVEVIEELRRIVEELGEGEVTIMLGDMNATYVGGEVSSALGLVIKIENETGSMIEKLVVKPRVESDHLPVEINIERKEKIREKKSTG